MKAISRKRPGALAAMVAATLLAFVARLAIESVLGVEFPFVTFFLAVVFSTWYGGARYGVAVLLISTLLENYGFHGTRFDFEIPSSDESVLLLIYVILGSMGIWLMNSAQRRKRSAEAATLLAKREVAERKAAEEELQKAQAELKGYAIALEKRVSERTRELEQSVNFLQGFVYSMAHEIRAPVRAIDGFVQVLCEEYRSRLDASGHDYCRRIMEAAKRLDQLIHDLLEYGTIGHCEMSLKAVELDHMVRQVITDAGLQDVITIRGDLGTVMAHPPAARIAISNLLTNAAKFVPAKVLPQIAVWTEDDGRRIRLCIEDNGIGIDPNYFDKIFVPFQKLHGVGAYSGTGIGLALVKLAMERVGGSVGVSSKPGEGSIFWLDFQRVSSVRRHEMARPKELSV